MTKLFSFCLLGVSCQKSVKDQALVFHTQVKSSGYNAAPQ